MTPMETTALKATGTATPLTLTLMSAGDVRIRAITATAITPYTGTRREFSLDHILLPGTAPSRLNAKSMRVQLVMQAMVQKSCPTVAISSTVPPHFEVRACAKIVATPPPPLVTPASFWTAKRNESSRIQPPMAE